MNEQLQLEHAAQSSTPVRWLGSKLGYKLGTTCAKLEPNSPPIFRPISAHSPPTSGPPLAPHSCWPLTGVQRNPKDALGEMRRDEISSIQRAGRRSLRC